jgi:hypothetical protein
MKAILKYILLTAARDWLFIGLFIAVIIASALSLFLGTNALSEEYEMKIAFIAGSTRLILSIGMVLFICFHIRRSFENREVDFIISRPISRVTFLLAYFISFFVLSLLLLLPVIGFIFVVFKPEFMGLLAWSLSIFCELIIMSSFAILSSLILKSAVSSVISCFGFYILSRIMGYAVSSIIIPAKLNNLNISTTIESLLKVLSSVFPRLDLFGQSNWLIYANIKSETLTLILTQSVIYISLILLMSIFDFKKKQF